MLFVITCKINVTDIYISFTFNNFYLNAAIYIYLYLYQFQSDDIQREYFQNKGFINQSNADKTKKSKNSANKITNNAIERSTPGD